MEYYPDKMDIEEELFGRMKKKRGYKRRVNGRVGY